MNVSSSDRRWIHRLIAEEKPAAALLLLAGIVGLVVANTLGVSATQALLHPTVGGLRLDIAWFATDGLLVIFFFVAGLELRYEFTRGSLTSLRDAAVPIFGAMFGMIVPAGIFLALAAPGARAAWGVPMATDLPLALALVAVAGRGLPLEFRAFILSLAIVDDALSILVIAAVFGGSVSVPWCLLTILLVVAYCYAQRRSQVAAFACAFAAWLAMLHTGIHATVLGIALGLVTASSTDRIRDRWQPVAGLLAVPLFVATSLAVPLSAGDIDGRLITALTLARIVGKPLGIWCGAVIAIRVFRPASAQPSLSYLVAGSVAGLGFSVPMLFAELGLDAAMLEATKVAILAALAVAGLAGALALLGLRRTATTE